MRPLHIPLAPGLPDAGAPGQWLGRDKYGGIYTLRWMAEKQCFGALGWRATHPRPWPELVLLQGEQEGFIIGHVEGPAIGMRPLNHILGSRPHVVLQDELHEGPERQPACPTPPPPADVMEVKGGIAQPWLWTVAMLFGLPAAALALVVIAVWLTPKGDCKPDPARGTAGLFTCRSAP